MGDPNVSGVGSIRAARMAARTPGGAAYAPFVPEPHEPFQAAFDEAPIGMAIFSPDERLLHINRAFCALLGYSAEELVAGSFRSLTHPDDVPANAEYVRRALAGELSTFQLEKRYLRRDGSIVWVLLSASLVRDGGGAPRYFISHVQDITARKRAEAELLLRDRAIAAVSCGVTITDAVAPGQPVIYVNRAFERITGYTAAEAIGRDCRYLHGPETDSQSAAALRRAMAEGQELVVTIRNYRKDGTPFWNELSLSPVRDGDGRLTHVVAIVNDVTARKEAEDALRRGEERYRVAVEGSFTAFFILESVRAEDGEIVDFRFVELNQRGVEMIGRPREEIVGARLCELLPINRTGGFFERYREVVRSGQGIRGEFSLPDGQGGLVWRRHEVVPIGDGIAITTADITDAKRTEERLRAAEKRFRDLVENLPAVTYLQAHDDAATGIYIAPQIETLLGYTPEEWLADPDIWIRLIHPDDRERVRAEHLRTNQTGEHFRLEYRMVARDGRVVWVLDDGQLVRDAEGRPLYWQGVFLDITSQKQAEEALTEQEVYFRSLVQNSSDLTVVVDRQGAIAYVTPSAHSILGYAPHEMRAFTPADLIHPDDLEQASQIVTYVAQHGAMLLRARHADGSWRHLEVVANDLTDDPVVHGVVFNARDVTDRVRFEEALERQALHDTLTGLPNRLLFNDRLEHALARAHRTGETHAVLFLDVDRFKVINDSLGHAAGDALLVQFAARLAGCVREIDTVARQGGDEFIILLEGVGRAGEAVAVAERIIGSLRQPFDLGGQEVFVTGSVGIAVSKGGQIGAGDLLRMADIALHRAKSNGRAGYAIFDASMNVYSVERVALESDLQHAIDRGELRVYYQPEIDLCRGEIIAAEALVRWQHPRHGLLGPGDFIGLAEETGRILAIDQWVLGEACRQQRAWRERFGARAPRAISVNLSARQFQRGDLVHAVAAALADAGLPPQALRLEITESVLVQDVQATAETLRALRALGVQVAIDDFGMGYSSLSYLSCLAVDTVKIDKSFITGLGRTGASRPTDPIVQAVAAMAHALGMQVTAEGIELDEQARRVRDAGCDAGQGYYFSRPLPPDQFVALLEAGAGWHATVAASESANRSMSAG